MTGARARLSLLSVSLGVSVGLSLGCGPAAAEDAGQDEAGDEDTESGGPDPGPPCSIPDPAFAARVRSELELEEGEPISTTAAAGIYSLGLNDAGVTDLDGLQCFTNLQLFYAAGNMITDPSPVAGLQNLLILNLEDNLLTSTSGIEDLPLMDTLVLNDNPIVELSGLDSLDALEILELDRTLLVDLSGLADMPTLRKLQISSTPLTDLSSLPSLPGLASIWATNGQLTALEVEADLPSLDNMDLTNNALTAFDASPEHMPKLRALILDRNPLVTLDGFAGFPSLVTLVINDVGVSDLSPLAGLELTLFHAADNGIADLSPVAHLPNMDLSGNAIVDLSALFPYAGDATDLDVSDNLIADPASVLGLELEPCTRLDIAGNPLPATVEDHFCELGVVVDSGCNEDECFDNG